MGARRSAPILEALEGVAPGRPLREGLDRIIKAKMGALIVVGDGPDVLNICSGGFLLDAAFSPQRLSELAKTDGAIILASDASRIARANVHLVPNPSTPTTETGTRHRTAERVARAIGVPVISVSEDMAVLTLYIGDAKHQLEPIPTILSRCNQALQTLERYKTRLTAVATELAALEVENLVTVQDVAVLLQRTEIVMRVAQEIERYLVELGTDGRLVKLQLSELMAGVEDDRRLLVRDYFQPDATWDLESAMETLTGLHMEQLLDTEVVAESLHLAREDFEVDSNLKPRGFRMLAKVPRLQPSTAERIVERYKSVDKIMRASADSLLEIDGVDQTTASAIRDAISHIAESSILDRYA